MPPEVPSPLQSCPDRSNQGPFLTCWTHNQAMLFTSYYLLGLSLQHRDIRVRFEEMGEILEPEAEAQRGCVPGHGHTASVVCLLNQGLPKEGPTLLGAPMTQAHSSHSRNN